MLKNKPFIRQNLEKTADLVNVRLNSKDREILNKFKYLIGNRKDSTALKLALFWAYNVAHRDFTGDIKVKLYKRRTQNVESIAPNQRAM